MQSSMDEEDLLEESYVTVIHGQGGQGSLNVVPAKVPPGFDGRTLWFACEEASDGWCDITELDPTKRGPALKSRLEGEAAIYKPMLDRDQLVNPDSGVEYVKRTLRPHFVKGAKNVFLYRLFAIFKKSRGQQDLLRWMGKYQVIIQNCSRPGWICTTILNEKTSEISMRPEQAPFMTW